MGFISNTETVGKERNKLCKEIVVSIRELLKQKSPDELTKDLAAFIALSLLRIHETIDISVEAWEKRDYWIKAERFRHEWQWTLPMGNKLCNAVKNDDLAVIAVSVAELAQKLESVHVGEKHRLGQPWVGAYRKLTGS